MLNKRIIISINIRKIYYIITFLIFFKNSIFHLCFLIICYPYLTLIIIFLLKKIVKLKTIKYNKTKKKDLTSFFHYLYFLFYLIFSIYNFVDSLVHHLFLFLNVSVDLLNYQLNLQQLLLNLYQPLVH